MGKVREWLNNNSAVVTVAAVVVLLLALWIIIRVNRGPSPMAAPTAAYYYDLNKNVLFEDKIDKIPPFDTDSGKDAGVTAYVFGCGDCKEKNRFIGYLERYTPEGKKQRQYREEQMKKLPPNQPPPPELIMMMDESRVKEVRAAEGGPWVPMMSPQGQQIIDKVGDKCPPGTRVISCFPGMK